MRVRHVRGRAPKRKGVLKDRTEGNVLAHCVVISTTRGGLRQREAISAVDSHLGVSPFTMDFPSASSRAA
jgi:hypothetical protein